MLLQILLELEANVTVLPVAFEWLGNFVRLHMPLQRVLRVEAAVAALDVAKESTPLFRVSLSHIDDRKFSVSWGFG